MKLAKLNNWQTFANLSDFSERNYLIFVSFFTDAALLLLIA